MSNYLSPLFNEQTFGSNGAPLSGGKIYTYLEGTSTAQVTYTTENGSTPQANPIILNTRGEPDNPIWLVQGIGYKFALYDSNDVLIRTIDRIDGINNPVDTTVDQWQPSGLTPTYISTTSFSYSGDQTSIHHVGRRVKTTNTAGTTYSVITSSSYAAGTTTIVVSNDSGTLDSGLSAVSYAILSASNVSLPRSKAARDALGLGAGADIASATTVDLTARTGNIVRITGTIPITGVTLNNGETVWCYAVGALPLTYHATNMPLKGGVNYTCTAGDIVEFTKDNNGTLSVDIDVAYTRNIIGGAAGSIPYQTSSGVTALLAAGTSGHVVRSTGASAPITTPTVDYQAFTATGTWTKPTGVTASSRVFVEQWGAGGGGSAGAGGGGGGYKSKWFLASELTATVAVTVPAGGAVDTAGGNTTFGGYLTSYGGGSGAPSNFGGGGGGGTTSAGASGSGTSGGAGGGGTYSTTAATNGTNFDCGATGPSAGGPGYTSYYGGGSGAYCSVAAAGGASVYGGGGGGTSAGTSVYGGNGGGTAAGTAPGGGGGTNGTVTGYAGARGECRVTTFL